GPTMRPNICTAIAIIALAATIGADEPQKPSGVFSMLKVGQSVSLKDEGSAYTISFLDPEVPQSHKIAEIGDDFIVVEDLAGVTETAIPVYAVKSIVRVKTRAE